MKGSLPFPHCLTLQKGPQLVGFQLGRGSWAGGSEHDRAGVCFGVLGTSCPWQSSWGWAASLGCS